MSRSSPTALVTGATGFVGGALAPLLARDGLHVRAFARNADRAAAVPGVDSVVEGDVITGRGLAEALDGITVAYYLIHSMEPGEDSFMDRERRSAETFAAAAQRAGVERIVYLGGPVPLDAEPSPHLASRLAVEEVLLDAAPKSIAFRASIVIAARSRSFRFLVRLVERLPVLALPGWRHNSTAPIDGRDVLAFLTRAATADKRLAGSWDIAGPDVMTYGELVAGIADAMLVHRPALGLDFSLTPVAAPVAAAVAGEQTALIQPLMEGLEETLLPRPDRNAAEPFGVRLHRFSAAVERALREWERDEELAAR